MNTSTATIPAGEVLSSTPVASASAIRAVSVSSAPAAPRRHPHLVRYADVAGDFDTLIDKAIAAITDGEPVADEILGHYVQVASLVRAVSFREGKLLEQAMLRLSQANSDLVVLMQSIKLPLVKAAIEAVAGNDWGLLESIRLDCDAPSKGTYTPDLIIINKRRHSAVILDLKRSLASYGDTTRMEELKMKMMASAMILPDWLYRTQKRVMVDTVGVAIVDGASRPSDHAAGIWALSEVDDLLEVDGAAACMMELRRRFGQRVQQLLKEATYRALGIAKHATLTPGSGLSRFALRGVRRSMSATGDNDLHDDHADGLEADVDSAEDDIAPAARIRIGFARRMLDA
ncbi:MULTISPECIES: hypothetical protein [unclassified Rhizobium]|uniref:hypothetical protein n=1 Tax=unclassified Rhizobium TaxID=2613769 RepID=UPI001AD9C0ED|nr:MULTISPECIES: hypothetical protein [unclassified Rhizobium]MBO9127730.1 hypothetical protein [Rhizobium sp. 16-488-2b]MBO9178192.1 hypothetical protein [Rhizobium sp. 16-488-2a]